MIKWSRSPAVVLGPPRAGTTVLCRLFDGHPASCAPQPYGYEPVRRDDPDPTYDRRPARAWRAGRAGVAVPVGGGRP